VASELTLAEGRHVLGLIGIKNRANPVEKGRRGGVRLSRRDCRNGSQSAASAITPRACASNFGMQCLDVLLVASELITEALHCVAVGTTSHRRMV
jgi:hypothetical protein